MKHCQIHLMKVQSSLLYPKINFIKCSYLLYTIEITAIKSILHQCCHIILLNICFLLVHNHCYYQCLILFLFAYMLGVINGTAPNPVRLSELCDQLGKVMGRPSWLPVPDFALKAVLGEGASVVKIPYHLCLFFPQFVYLEKFYGKLG